MSADRWGVAHGYYGNQGQWLAADPETRAAVRRTLGAPEHDDDNDPGPLDDGAIVHTIGDPTTFAPHTSLQLEDGTSLGLANGLPSDTPIGYHSLIDAEGHERRFIVAPNSCVAVPNRKSWGWAVQLYAMRSKASWGIGEFDDLRTLTDWSAQRGADMVLINPLHTAMPILSQQPSPYFPSSRCFRNPLYLNIASVPGATDLDTIDTQELATLTTSALALNDNRRIDRDAVFTLKMRALDVLWRQWNERTTPRHQLFSFYRAEQGDALENYATFCAIAEQRRSAWMDWPMELQQPGTQAVRLFVAEHRDRVDFHAWVQWLVDEQLRTCSPNVDLMTDLAIGVDRGGADVWMWRDSFALDMRVGAPPDTFNTQGQNWGLPPFDPWRLRRNGYEAFRRVVQAAFRHAQALRMDHVMGLFRLYWIPEGESATKGCYVYVPFRDLLGIVALESVRANAYVVGEDLGTVESYVREELSTKKILSYRLRQFESGPSSEFPEQALAAITTHDLPTIPGFWSREDVTTQTAMGLKPNAEGTEEIRTRLAELSGVPSSAGDDHISDVVVGAYRDLATAPCAVLTACLDDALGVRQRPNMPGTIDEWPNWRIALPVSLEEILVDPRVEAVANALDRTP